VFVPEVPGVVIVDRVCIQWQNCGSCNNQCDCNAVLPVSGTTTTSPFIPFAAVCEDFQWENLIIAVLSFIVVCPLCLWFHHRCISPWTYYNTKDDYDKKIKEGKYKPSTGMADSMTSMTASMSSGYHDTLSAGMNPEDLRTLKATTFKSGYYGYTMACANFFSTAIISFAFVHAVYWAWNFLMWVIFEVWRDLVWNAIDIEVCWWSLFPLCIALWLMNWLSLVYFYAFFSISYTDEVCQTPVSVAVEGYQESGAYALWRFWK